MGGCGGNRAGTTDSNVLSLIIPYGGISEINGIICTYNISTDRKDVPVREHVAAG
jgi:hypothetical protein